MLGKIKPDYQQNLFKTRLTDLINFGHPLVKLAQEISWDKMFKESDESVVERRIENAYWQYFTGEEFFQIRQPFDPSEIEDSSNTKINIQREKRRLQWRAKSYELLAIEWFES